MSKHSTTVSILLAPALLGCLALFSCTKAENPGTVPEPTLKRDAGKATGESPGGEGARQAALDAKALIQKRCTGCHSTDRIYDHKHSRAEWEKVVERMVRKGAKLDASEREAVIKYLSAR